MTLSLGLMIGGALAAVLGVILLLTRMGTVKLLGGLVLAVIGLGAVGVGYTLDQHSLETYSVVEAIPISTRVDEDCYRVTLKSENGVDTWIYVNGNQVMNYQVGNKVTLQKSVVNSLREREAE
ncbi:MAG: hypothetical protein K5695_06060 [Oscillospiraceae bacterium]|nr:hypothetical protein [Oscillospiraceae bacterium]